MQAADDDTDTWIPARHVGDLDIASGSLLLPGSAFTVAAFGSKSADGDGRWVSLSRSLPLTPPLSAIPLHLPSFFLCHSAFKITFKKSKFSFYAGVFHCSIGTVCSALKYLDMFSK